MFEYKYNVLTSCQKREVSLANDPVNDHKIKFPLQRQKVIKARDKFPIQLHLEHDQS